MEWAQRHLADRDCHESAYAVLAIEVCDLPEPLDEAGVVGERLTALWTADDERRGI
jgi:hypothetical protein